LHPSVASDLQSAFNDTFATVAVKIGDSSTRGFEDAADQIETDSFGEEGRIRVRVITIQAGALDPDLDIDATIEIEGTERKVRDFALADDGQLEHIVVAG
jgi:hypothetical protein